jgi:putative CocE/NonD family hydrolase
MGMAGKMMARAMVEQLSGNRLAWGLLLGATFLLANPGAAFAAWPPAGGRGECMVTKTTDVSAKMRDGVMLKADIYRPQTKEKVPVILMRTQYGKAAAQIEPARFQTPDWFASHCYIVVIQDIRGQGASSGTFYEYANDRNDGFDTVEWAAKLPGSNGKVGMYGSSYVGATQWLAATGAPPSLKAIVPSNTASDYYDGWTYEDGAFRLAFIEPWMAETIGLTAAINRGDKEAAAQMEEANKNMAQWGLFQPYDKVPFFQPGNPAVAPYFFDAIKHSTDDAYWRKFSIQNKYDKVGVAVLAFDGWYDAFINGSLKNFNGVKDKGSNDIARSNSRIVIGPWEHLGWGRPESMVSPRLHAISAVANSPVNDLSLSWFDRFLKGKSNQITTGSRVTYFTMGEEKWHVSKDWPLAGAKPQNWYLASGGHANSVMGDGVLTDAPPQGNAQTQGQAHADNEFGSAVAAAKADANLDNFVYDPSNPVPSMGGHSCCSWTTGPQGQFDQSAVEQRPDILVYSSAPLKQAMEVTGQITVTLYARTTAPDTDFTAKLVDVFPDGTAINLANGIQKASYRESLSNPIPVVPGQVYQYKINVWPTSNLFKLGHRIRLEISSSDFPQFAPNSNTGETFGTSAKWQKATQTILHDAAHPSAVILPMIPAGAGGPALDAVPVD